jgi:hypothetical protein
MTDLSRRAALGLGAGLLITAGSTWAETGPPRSRVQALKITVLSTMLADAGLGEWGSTTLSTAVPRHAGLISFRSLSLCENAERPIARAIPYLTGNAVRRTTSRRAMEELMRATPGRRVRRVAWMRSRSSTSAATTRRR